jgi:hypothetical protein
VTSVDAAVQVELDETMTTRLLNLTDQGLPESYVLIKKKP